MSAIVIISLSEIQKVLPWITKDYVRTNLQEFNKILFSLGLDTSKNYEVQTGKTHRNKFNQVVSCDRYSGSERIDPEWIESRYSSREARNLASGSLLIQDLDMFRDEDSYLSCPENTKQKLL